MSKILFKLICQITRKKDAVAFDNKTFVLAHRGITSIHLENTKEALSEINRFNIDGAELDVHVASDGFLVVTHDNYLKRLFDINKQISDLEIEEITSITSKDGYKICELSEVLRSISTGKIVNIELKETFLIDIEKNIENLLQKLAQFENKLKIVVSSFEPAIIKELLRQKCKFSLGLLLDKSFGLFSFFQALNLAKKIDFLNPHIDLVSKRVLKIIEKKNIFIIVWGHKYKNQKLYPSKNIWAVISDVSTSLL